MPQVVTSVAVVEYGQGVVAVTGTLEALLKGRCDVPRAVTALTCKPEGDAAKEWSQRHGTMSAQCTNASM